MGVLFAPEFFELITGNWLLMICKKQKRMWWKNNRNSLYDMWLGERLPMTRPVWVDKGRCVFRSTYVCFDL